MEMDALSCELDGNGSLSCELDGNGGTELWVRRKLGTEFELYGNGGNELWVRWKWVYWVVN